MAGIATYLGIDVQVKRGAFYAVLDHSGRMCSSGCLDASQGNSLRTLFNDLIAQYGEMHVGIDAPRRFILAPRDWYWEGNRRRWRKKRLTDRGYGRHCEVVIKAHGLANPQWTPPQTEAPEWMLYGVSLFKELEPHASVHEVFPTASYTLLSNVPEVRAEIDFTAFSKGAKDALDAIIAAVTVREFIEGWGAAVGGGDRMGQIILPRPIPDTIHEVMKYPREGNTTHAR
jgi:predicted nuclease with RNAse H fold